MTLCLVFLLILFYFGALIILEKRPIRNCLYVYMYVYVFLRNFFPQSLCFLYNLDFKEKKKLLSYKH